MTTPHSLCTVGHEGTADTVPEQGQTQKWLLAGATDPSSTVVMLATGWAAPDDRSILHEDANRCFTEQPVLFGHPASNPHPGRASSSTATYSCPVALCAGQLSHADGGAVGRNTAWHASALADLALRQAPTPRSGDRPVATHPMGWGSTPSCMQQREAMSRSPQR